MRDSAFDETLSGAERVAWKAFEAVATNLLGNVKESRVLKNFSVPTKSWSAKCY
jgi:hypothetical protein